MFEFTLLKKQLIFVQSVVKHFSSLRARSARQSRETLHFFWMATASLTFRPRHDGLFLFFVLLRFQRTEAGPNIFSGLTASSNC